MPPDTAPDPDAAPDPDQHTDSDVGLDPGWLAEVDGWIRTELAALGVTPAGPVRTFRVRPWSVVRRVDSNAGPVWFKAPNPGSGYEAALAEALTGWVPDRVLPTLAVRLDAGWLLCPHGGTTLHEAAGDRPELGDWEVLLRSYAELQRALTGRADDILALGVPDTRPTRLAQWFGLLLADPTVGLTDESRRTLSGLAPAYAGWCAELAADGVPASVQHDDLSGGNAFVGGTGGDGFLAGSGPRFFDWGDASVAHPFCSLLIALNVAGYVFGLKPGAPELARLRDAYLEPWTGVRDRAGLRRSATLAVRVARVGRALSWQRALRGAAEPGWQRTLGPQGTITPEYATAVAAWLETLTEPDLA